MFRYSYGSGRTDTFGGRARRPGRERPRMTPTRASVGVVGAAVTGRSVLHHAADASLDAVAFVSNAETGGVVRSETVEGRVVAYALRKLVRRPDPPPVASLERGLQALPRTLADRHADRVHLADRPRPERPVAP